MVLVDIHGSCISRNIFNVDKDTDISVNNYISRSNIVSSMMPPADITTKREELLFFDSEYSHRCLRNGIEKNTVPMLLDSIAEFLVIDFFDLCQPVAVYQNTTFPTYDYSFYNTAAYKNESDQFQSINFLEIPTCLWYGYIDIYWKKMMKKFGDNIVLVRVSCFNNYIASNKEITPTPPNLLAFGNDIYNAALFELENYIIEKYNPYVLDVSKYFIADEDYEPDVTPVHFEENYNISSWSLMKDIILNKPKQRYYDNLRPEIFAQLLERPVDDRDFEFLWKERGGFVACDLLDSISLEFTSEEIIKNRKWLATLYHKTDHIYLSNHLKDKNVEISLINDFINGIDMLEANNYFKLQFINRLKEKQSYLNQPVGHLVEEYLEALDKGDLRWIQMLSCLSILLPDDQGIIYNQLQYHMAIDNKIMAFKLKQRLDSPPISV